MKRFVQLTILGAALLCLPGCSTTEDISSVAGLPCPKVGLVDDARMITRFAGDGFTEDDYYSRASISDFRGGCEYSERKVKLEFNVQFHSELGPAAIRDKHPRKQQYDYFIAVLSPEDKVLVKDVRTIKVPFGKDVTISAAEDKVSLKIPFDDPVKGPAYKVVMGFQLDAEQVAFNRRNKPRFPDE